MRLGILQTGDVTQEFRAKHGDLPELFVALFGDRATQHRTWRVMDGTVPEDLSDADLWVITGSIHAVYEDHSWLGPLFDLIRKAARDGVPIIGVCFGHQAMAAALGGHVERFSEGWTVGRQVYSWGGKARAINAWHQDQVVVPPPAAEVLATSGSCTYAALRYGPRAVSIQAHPEYGSAPLQTLIETRGRPVPTDRLANASASLELPLDRETVANDLKLVVRP
ncbi:MAG: type 1 glutamine amidotransferase [Pseudomonadota bacterium]